MPVYLVAILIGVIAGLRTFTAPAAVCWAVHLGWLPVQDTPLAFLDLAAMPYIFTALAFIELISDKLPKTPSRKQPIGFGARIVSSGLCGAAIGATSGAVAAGIAVGVVGAVIGTLAGYEARTRLAKAIGSDLPVALLEDLIAVGGAALLMVELA